MGVMYLTISVSVRRSMPSSVVNVTDMIYSMHVSGWLGGVVVRASDL